MKQSYNGSKSKTERDWTTTTTTTTTKTGKLQKKKTKINAPKISYFIIYDPYGTARNFVGKPQKRIPVRGPYASSDRAGKNALEKCARSEANAARNAFLPLRKIQKHNRHFQMIKCLLYARSVSLDRQQNIFPSGST